MRFASEGVMMLALRKFLFRLVVLVVKMWLVKALFLRILPLPVFLNLLAAPRFVFIFGIIYSAASYSLLGTTVLLSNSSDGNFSSLASVFFVTGGLGTFG